MFQTREAEIIIRVYKELKEKAYRLLDEKKAKADGLKKTKTIKKQLENELSLF